MVRRTAGRNTVGADVCQRRRHRTRGAGVRGQGNTSRHGHSFHDGRRGAVAARSHAAEESDDMAANRHILRRRHRIHHPFGISVQRHTVMQQTAVPDRP